MDYIIAALPRSRTYWLSVFLSTRGRSCHHDALGKVSSIDGLPAMSGMSETGAALYEDELREKFPDARWIVVQRPLHEVKQSIERLGGNPALLDWDNECLARAAETADLVIPFYKMDDYRYELWHTCSMPGPFDSARWDFMSKINLQTKIPEVMPPLYARLLERVS